MKRAPYGSIKGRVTRSIVLDAVTDLALTRHMARTGSSISQAVRDLVVAAEPEAAATVLSEQRASIRALEETVAQLQGELAQANRTAVATAERVAAVKEAVVGVEPAPVPAAPGLGPNGQRAGATLVKLFEMAKSNNRDPGHAFHSRMREVLNGEAAGLETAGMNAFVPLRSFFGSWAAVLEAIVSEGTLYEDGGFYVPRARRPAAVASAPE